MRNLKTLEIKTFVPSKDFELSKRFYADLGFEEMWSDSEVAFMKHGDTAFLLQNYYVEEHASNFMMHLLVEDLDAWWKMLSEQQLETKYAGTAIKLDAPQSAEEFAASDPPAGAIRDFILIDPTGVLWRIAEASS